MGRLNDARRLAAKAKQLLAKNDVKVKEALDKAAGAVDSRTKGRYSDKIEGAVSKAKQAVDKLPDRASTDQDRSSAPPGETDADQRDTGAQEG
jgi:hypothetical protein